jgi:Spy/CpxP family protein refolding chaperone
MVWLPFNGLFDKGECMTRTLRLVVIGLLLLAAVPALAQERQGRRGGQGFGGGFGRGGGGLGMGPAQLVGIEQVQKELELVDDQKQEIAKITEDSRQGLGDLFGGLRDLPQEERQAKMREMREKMEARNKETEEKINKVLLAHQQKRLKEIALQVRGIAALSDDAVAKELALSADQKDQIKKVTEDADQARRDLFQNAGGDREGLREKGQAIRTESEQKALAVLTADQKTKFEDMKGKKFELDRSALPGGGRGFGGGGGGGRGRGGNQ